MESGLYRRRPYQVGAARYDGTIDGAEYLMSWVKQMSPRQELYGGGDDGHLVLHGPEGTTDMFEGWWLVYDTPQFVVLMDEEFHSKFEKEKK